MRAKRIVAGSSDHYGLHEAMSIIEANKHLIDRLEQHHEIASIMDCLEKIANQEGTPVTTLLKVIWALEIM